MRRLYQICAKMHWKVHEAECQQRQAELKLSCDETPNPRNALEVTIASFDSGSFTIESFLAFYATLEPFIFMGVGVNRSNLNGVTVAGYSRLLALAVRAAEEYPHHLEVADASLNIFVSYTYRYCTNNTGFTGADAFYKSRAAATVNCIRLHIADELAVLQAWRVFNMLASIVRTKCMEGFKELGIVDLAILCIERHAKCEEVCYMVVRALTLWITCLRIRHIPCPFNNLEELLAVLLLTMKRLATSEMVQLHCSEFLPRPSNQFC